MAGHDFDTNEDVQAQTQKQDWSLCGDGVTIEPRAVVGAVEDFAMKLGLTISVTYLDNSVESNWPSWMIQKPTVPECVKSKL
jgi:hypothetical protein